MDCDDAMLLLARSEPSTLALADERSLREHVATCDACTALEEAREQDSWRWLVRVHPDALEDRELLVLPMVDPIVFGTGTELARGGMGRIVRAFDRRLGRDVAIKESLDEGLRARFEREVRITARLQHPAIVPIYEAGTFPDGSTFYTMRLVSGRTLHEAIGKATTVEARLRLMPHVRAVADALAYAHARGVIHRDLKPGNVLVGEFGETVVIDWGLAKELDRPDDVAPTRPSAGPGLTRVGSVLGTPYFMSPAQAAGTPAGTADDVYALGALLYHLLAGAPPYYDSVPDSSEAAIAATLEGPPTPLEQLAPDTPADLRAIAERAMARDKLERFPTAKEFAEELARFEAGQLLLSRAYTVRELAARWLRRHRRAAIVALAGVVAAITLVIMWTRYRHAADELAVRDHGAKLTAFYGEVARQASRIDHELLQLEAGLEGLATAAGWALAGPEPAADKIYFTDDFAVLDRRPLDFGDSAYRWPVSVEYPVVAVAPGTDRDAVLPKIRRLSPLRHHIRDMVATAAGVVATDALLRGRTSPIDYAYVDLAEGVHVVWPGMAALRTDYDARTASFYKMSDHKRGSRWGSPYVDSTTDQADDLVLPCTAGVWSPTGEYFGVAGVEITVTKMVDTSMKLATRSVLRASLVNGAGRVVVDSRNAHKWFVASGKDEAVDLPEFDVPDITTAIQTGLEGIRETTRDGHAVVVAFVRLEAIHLTYVVEIAAATID